MGMMLDLARSLKLKPQLPDSFPILLPTSFSSTSSSSVNEEVLRELQSFQQGKHIAKAVAYALEGGKWTLYRELYDKDSQKVSVVEGNVQFHRIHSDAGAGKVQAGSCGIDGEGSCGNTADTPVLPTTPLTSSDLFQNPFLWYHENGQIKLPNGMKLDVSQSYIYRYDEESDSLDIFFSKVGESQEIDRPFIRLKFSPVDEGWLAKAYHLCGEDHYHASYLISFSGLNITKMEVVFDVLGPKKNYRSTTYFTAAGQE